MRFTEEHEAIRNTVAQFIDNEINPYCDQWEKDGIFPAHDLFRKMGDLGLLGIAKPTEYGGMGLDYSYQIVFSEELGRIGSGGVSMGIGVQTDMATPAMAKFGSDYIKQEFLSKAISGEAVCSIAVSEPHAGSDVANIKTTAVKDGDEWVLNGTKMWISSAEYAGIYVVWAISVVEGLRRNFAVIRDIDQREGIVAALLADDYVSRVEISMRDVHRM